MSRPKGGYIGFNASPTTAAASGVWTLAEASRYRGAGEWPEAVSGNGNGLTGFAVSGNAGDYTDVLGTYCPDGTANGKTRYKNDEDYYLLYVSGYWLITWLGDETEIGDFNHLWAASSESDTPPATFFGNVFLNASAENLTVSAASCP